MNKHLDKLFFKAKYAAFIIHYGFRWNEMFLSYNVDNKTHRMQKISSNICKACNLYIFNVKLFILIDFYTLQNWWYWSKQATVLPDFHISSVERSLPFSELLCIPSDHFVILSHFFNILIIFKKFNYVSARWINARA